MLAPMDCWSKLRIVHCGVDPDLFKLRRHSGRGEQLLFIGRLAVAKGLPVLLQALTALDGIRLDIAGDGPDRNVLENLARTLRIADQSAFSDINRNSKYGIY